MRTDYFVGLDLGQSADPTAIAVVERAEFPGEWDAVAYTHRIEMARRLRHMERMALGTLYPEVVERVAQVMRSPALSKGRRHLVVDATGVGRPVVDLLVRERLPCQLWAVTITGGDAETYTNGYYRVPKRDLIVGLQLVFQNRELQIAKGLKEGPALAREMSGMRVRVRDGGREQFGAREGEHDDLVLAVALACWAERKGAVGGRQMRLL